MRKFKCHDCDHSWELPFGQGGRGVEQVCTQCGSRNVHRIKDRSGGGRGERGGGRWFKQPETQNTSIDE